MGEDLKRWQNVQFKHQQDKSFQEFRARDLFADRPEVFSMSIECELVEGVVLSQGDNLVASRGSRGDVVILRDAIELVGRSTDPILFEVVERCHSIHRVELEEYSNELKCFNVRVQRGDDE
jgi:hypothetical protein